MTAFADLSRSVESFRERDALVWRDRAYTFDDLLAGVADWRRILSLSGLAAGAVVAIEGDYSPAGVTALLAVWDVGAIAVPLTARVEGENSDLCAEAGVEWRIRIDPLDERTVEATGRHAEHVLISALRNRRHPGLILFSSGSTGPRKAVVHDMELLVRKYLKPRHCYRTLAFLVFDHIGGIDTLLYNLSNGSCLVAVADRSPDTVCAAIAAHRVEVLPVSPTFLNLLLLSGANEQHDLSSLRIITYGAEVMQESTLARLRAAFPNAVLTQKYGTTEIGTMRSQSRSSGSLWVKLGGEGYEARVVEGLLEVKAESAMMGYMNGASPFSTDGWFRTGDAVDVDGEWFRFLGRKSEVINVGGEKVYPSEVEGVLQEMDGVEEVAVVGEPNVITGEIVVAKVKLRTGETAAAFRKRVWDHCRGRLPRHKIPQKVTLLERLQGDTHFKKMRRTVGEEAR